MPVPLQLLGTPTPTPDPPTTPLDLYMFASEAPLDNDFPILDDQPGIDWSIEDIDLLPTFADFQIVYQRITDFSQKHPRARKAVIRSFDEKPTYRTVQTLYFVALFATWKGQPEAGKPFLQLALDLIIRLRLDIDPDYSPWLYHLNLTPRQKEDRRRAFWACFLHMKFHQTVSIHAVAVNITSGKIRPPAAVLDAYSIFDAMPYVVWMCHIYDILGAIKRHHAKPPNSVDNVLASKESNSICSRLIRLQSNIPENLLIADTAETLTAADSMRFALQLAPLSNTDKVLVITSNADIFAAFTYLSKESQLLISNSVDQCLENAFRIANLLPMIAALDFYAGATYPIFEGMIVFWFMLLFVQTVNLAEGTKTGTTAPMLACMEAMYQEMVDVESGIVGCDSLSESVSSVEEIELGMKIVSLDDTISINQVSVIKEPHCFLGLLGMEVGGRVRWKGPTEESWRLFWKLYS
ncbi:UNVERIFIED_CONTAM: hypothetical protein HDU68_012135 [Siphonaria sp. JEL0065]|nr:hypothetical protein HDU68_012135 [Siphonaria sp. JEL0065]